ncbi:tfoX C-terminal domain protein, partial [Vibrio harveyi]
EVCWRH